MYEEADAKVECHGVMELPGKFSCAFLSWSGSWTFTESELRRQPFQADISTLSKPHNRKRKKTLLIRTIHFFGQFHSVSLGQEVAAVTRPHMVKVDTHPQTASCLSEEHMEAPPIKTVTCDMWEHRPACVSLQLSLWISSDLCSHPPLSHKQWRHKHLLVLRYVQRDTNRHTHVHTNTNTHLPELLICTATVTQSLLRVWNQAVVAAKSRTLVNVVFNGEKKKNL